MLEKGANPSVADQAGETSLYFASSRDRPEEAKLLPRKSTEVAPVNDYGWTPLVGASYESLLFIVQLLVDNGADLNTGNREGWTPFNIASSKRNVTLAQ